MAYLTLEQQQMCPKNHRVDDESPARELGETERPDVKYTPQHKRKEKLEDKMIEFIDLTAKQSVAEMAPPPPAAPPVPKDYVGSQLEAIGHALRNSLDAKQQFQCLYEMNNVLYRYVTNVQFPIQNQHQMQNQQNYPPAAEGGPQQGPMMRELNFQAL